MHDYTYRVLVVDDEKHLSTVLKLYKTRLAIEKKIDVDFKLINDISDYNPEEPFDILLVDFKLNNAFDGKNGDEFIKKFRDFNHISKVIFFSSEFNPSKTERLFPNKKLFSLINDLQIDKISYKNDTDMMIEQIYNCCSELDILPMILKRQFTTYSENDIDISYTDEEGNIFRVDELIKQISLDSETGKSFRKKITETVLRTILNYRY